MSSHYDKEMILSFKDYKLNKMRTLLIKSNTIHTPKVFLPPHVKILYKQILATVENEISKKAKKSARKQLDEYL